MNDSLDIYYALQPGGALSPWVSGGQILVLGAAVSVVLYFAIGWILRFTGIENLFHRFL